jgi:hypothetical protein
MKLLERQTIKNERVSYEKLNYEPAAVAYMEKKSSLASLNSRRGDPLPGRDAAGPIG